MDPPNNFANDIWVLGQQLQSSNPEKAAVLQVTGPSESLLLLKGMMMDEDVGIKKAGLMLNIFRLQVSGLPGPRD